MVHRTGSIPVVAQHQRNTLVERMETMMLVIVLIVFALINVFALACAVSGKRDDECNYRDD